MWRFINKEKKNIISVENEKDYSEAIDNGKVLCCVPRYPAIIEEYEDTFHAKHLSSGISDHTVGLNLYHKYKPKIYEKHYYIDGLESWDREWAIKPEELRLL